MVVLPPSQIRLVWTCSLCSTTGIWSISHREQKEDRDEDFIKICPPFLSTPDYIS